MSRSGRINYNNSRIADKYLCWKRRLGWVWNFLPKKANRRVILIYHSVGSGPWSVPVDAFREQMAWLQEYTHVEALDELIKEPSRGGLRVALTFDDGYKSVYSVAAHILETGGFPATVYLNTGWIADEVSRSSDATQGHYPNEEFLTWKQVIELKNKGWIIGSHGVQHYDLTRLTLLEAERQIKESKEQIEEKISTSCIHFSYTWGHSNKDIRNVARQVGYRYAVTGRHAPLSKSFDSLALPRVNIMSDYTLDDFVAIVRGLWDYLGIIKRIPRYPR